MVDPTTDFTPVLAFIALVFSVGGSIVAGLAFIFRRGKKEGVDDTCLKNIESNLNKHIEFSEEYIKKNEEDHQKLENKVTKLDEKVDQIAEDVAYIRGSLSK